MDLFFGGGGLGDVWFHGCGSCMGLLIYMFSIRDVV